MNAPPAVGILLPAPLIAALVGRAKANPGAPIVYIVPMSTWGGPVPVPGTEVFVLEEWCADHKPMLYRATTQGDTYGGETIQWRSADSLPWEYSRPELRRTVTRVDPEKITEIEAAAVVAAGIELTRPDITAEWGVDSEARFCLSGPWQEAFGDDPALTWNSRPWVWVITGEEAPTNA